MGIGAHSNHFPAKVRGMPFCRRTAFRFRPSGGYFKKGGKFASPVAEIKEVIETHMKLIGFTKDEAMDDSQSVSRAKKSSVGGGERPTADHLRVSQSPPIVDG